MALREGLSTLPITATTMINPLTQQIPSEIEFSLADASFVERDGFLTISDPEKQKELKLPRWAKSPMRYYVAPDGKVWGRHFTQQKRHLKFNSINELIKEWRKENEEYLTKNGYALSDVHD